MTSVKLIVITWGIVFLFVACNNDESSSPNCISTIKLNVNRGACNATLPFSSEFQQIISGTKRIITTNSIPDHKVGLFGNIPGALNPNTISEQSGSYTINLNPSVAISFTPLLSSSGIKVGPQYSFGILLNGIELDPVAAEPFPHQEMMDSNVNWNWNLEALNVNLGLDCNNGHVQPNGKYHYHSSPISYLENLNVSDTEMTLIGYAADGFPIYYKYAYANASDNTSKIIEMVSSYRLKTGKRSGDGISAPCGTYNGVYTNDYEFVEGLGILDEANGRVGVTPDHPSGTYYYVITDNFPSIPRYFRGTPSNDFQIGR